MKKFKKIMAVLVAAIMVVAMCVPAWAAATPGTGRFPTTTGTLTITKAQKEATYNAYRILTLASFNDDDAVDDKHAGDAYSYVVLSTSPWKTFFSSDTTGSKYFEVSADTVTLGDGLKYNIVTAKPDVTSGTTFEGLANPFADTDTKDETSADEWKSNSLVQEFAQAAVAFAKVASNGVTADATGTATADNQSLVLKNASNNTALPLGYYVIDSTQGTLCSLDTMTPNISIDDKNMYPTVTKSVQEDSLVTGGTATPGDSATAYQHVNDAKIGDTIYYNSLIKVEDGAEGYVLHDDMDLGLTFTSGSIKVYYLGDSSATAKSSWINLTNDEEVKIGSVAFNHSGGYTDYYTLGSAITDGCEFEVVFDDDFLLYLSDNMSTSVSAYYLLVTYEAILNEKAVIGGSGNVNTTKLSYGTNMETVTSKTTTYTWPIFVEKSTTLPSGEKNLPGAMFELYESEAAATAGTDPYKFVLLAAGDVGYDSNVTYPQYKVIRDIPAGATAATLEYTAAGGTAATGTGAYVVNYKTGSETYSANAASTHSYFTTITTDTTGKFAIYGLDADTYYLKETQAPNGYDKLAYPVRIVITSKTKTSGSADLTSASLDNLKYTWTKTSGTTYTGESTLTTIDKDHRIDVENTTHTELPSTGGMGTTVLYIVGGMLVILAGAYLFFSRKKTA